MQVMDTTPLKAISHSELKTYQRCPKQWEYKYVDRLVPVGKQRPLFLGSWIHSCLETYYVGGDWKEGHAPYVAEYNKLFDEEKDVLDKAINPKTGKRKGTYLTLPQIVERVMQSYVWYNREDGWKVIATEQEFEVDTPLKIDGRVQPFQGIIDLVVEDEDGKWWVIDHKTASTIPDPNSFHTMDPQLMLYPWAAEKAWGWKIEGVIYNYVRSKPPSVPKLNKDGSLSKRKFTTDYPTLFRFLRSSGYDPNDFRDILKPLQRKSPFLRRYKLPREAIVTKNILTDALATAKRLRTAGHNYRVITRDCARMCSYHDLCRAELNGFDTTAMRKKNFTPKEERVFGNRTNGEYADDDDFEDEEDE